MNRLCLSIALLFLLVILVDSTPVYEHHTQNQGLETSLRRRPEKRSIIDVISHVIDGVVKGTKIFHGLKGLADIIGNGIQGQVMISRTQVENHTVEEFLTQILKNAASKPEFCLEPELKGPCKDQLTRYFYNATAGYCKPFVYGGCEGNKNNFQTLSDCLVTCSPVTVSLWRRGSSVL
ncbi:trophoblast Kunitz domain protein 1-like [Budorcas taxicolor]|uniref:trophoblast Kunitz domain protein 1-like n=1 Tax=Budorcas taxicolor TaxID=37181 RepID=UPI0022846FDB|nr:trophoblast Kunitz domain protein 1-like [Budorcas taxicolor]